MTTDQWIALATPIIGFLIPTIAAVLGLMLSGIMERLRGWLEAHKHAQASAIVADASVRMQAAMQNEAGQIALRIASGEIKLSDLKSLQALSALAEQAIKQKLPDAVIALRPEVGSIAGGVYGKITGALPVPDAPVQPQTSTLVLRPDTTSLPSEGNFQARASIVVGRLMRDLALTREQACGIVGNLGQESGLRAINEIRPVAGRGGFGWAQWTGPRRLTFEAWAKAQGMSVTDDEANYGFLLDELRNAESGALDALRQTTTLEEATRVFEERYERAGVVALARRQALAQQALAA